jgi:hypothetical protein
LIGVEIGYFENLELKWKDAQIKGFKLRFKGAIVKFKKFQGQLRLHMLNLEEQGLIWDFPKILCKNFNF